MAEDGSQSSGMVAPLPKFCFQVTWGTQVMTFEEVSGLETPTQVVEYRHGDNAALSTLKMPGIQTVGNVTLKKGIALADSTLWDWYNRVKMNTIKRVPVTISLLDEAGQATMTWTLANAWPTKITGTDLKSDGNYVAIDSVQVVHEGLTISNGASC